MAYSFVVSREVPVGPEVVFESLQNPSLRTQWMSFVTAIQRHDAGPPGLGTRWTQTTRPREHPENFADYEITEYESPHLITFTMNGPPKGPANGSFQSVYRLHPSGAGTRIELEFRSNTTGIAGMLLRLTKVPYQLKCKDELNDLARWLSREIAPAMD